MYYDNKFRFFIKEYTVQIVVAIACIVLVVSGLFIRSKLNNNVKPDTTITATTTEGTEQTEVPTVTVEDDSILPEDLKSLKAGEKISVKVASVDNEGNLVIMTGTDRIKARLIGANYSKTTADTFYSMNSDLEGKYVDIAFDETKVSNGYAMIYVYTTKTELYNAKLLKEGKLVFDTNVNKKALEYNNLAESQAYAKQTLAGVWGE